MGADSPRPGGLQRKKYVRSSTDVQSDSDDENRGKDGCECHEYRQQVLPRLVSPAAGQSTMGTYLGVGVGGTEPKQEAERGT